MNQEGMEECLFPTAQSCSGNCLAVRRTASITSEISASGTVRDVFVG
jgi:hypothetical protein